MKTLVSSLRRNHRLQSAIYLALAPGLLTFSMPVQANPEGAQVVIGDVGFQGLGTAKLDIFNNSQTAVINWQSFSIDKGEITSIIQGANATTLNRVISGNPSAIYGQLKAEAGNVLVINPNGVIVHAGGTINVAGMLTVSTLDISDSEFMSGGIGRFRGNTGAGVENYGSVSSANGDVVFLGNFLRNEGEVSALGGTVAFGAGGDILVGTGGGGVISVQAGGAGGDTGIVNSGSIDAASVELKATGNVYALAIQNDGVVRAKGYNFSGGKLTLSAGPSGRIINTGNLEARNVNGRGGQIDVSGGRVEISSGNVDASGDYGRAGGSVAIRGTDVSIGAAASVDASGSTGGSVSVSSTGDTTVGGSLAATGGLGAGGVVKVEGSDISVGSQAKVDVSGQTGGGTVVIGGGFQGRDANVQNAESLTVAQGAAIIADAVEGGSGGVIVLWSDGDTLFEGDVSAHGVSKGGFIEISGKQSLAVGGTVDLAATSGISGTLLLDPTNVTISAVGANAIGGSTISNVFLSNLLDAGTNVVISTNFGGAAEAGDIVIGRTTNQLEAAADRIEWYQDSVGTPGGTLTLLAMGDIRFNTSVHSAGSGGINVVAGWDGVTGWDGITGLNGSNQFIGYAQNSPVFNIGAVLTTFADNFGTTGNLANDAAGLRSGSVFVGSTNTQIGVDVGSRYGATNVAAHDLLITGSGVRTFGWAQLGFHDSGYEFGLGSTYNTVQNEWWGSSTGNVTGKNYIALLGGTEFTAGAPAVAAGQFFRGAGFGATGDIRAELSGRLDLRGGLNNAYTQIGHGASVADGVEPHLVVPSGVPVTDPTLDRVTRDGIRMNPGTNRRSYFSSTWRTNYAGDAARIDADIAVNAKEDVLLFGAAGFEFVDEQVTDVRSGTYSMIGHGGAENHGSYHGDISVIADGATPEGFARGSAGIGIQLLGGRGTKSQVQIGHGSSSEGNNRIFDQSRSGNITVVANTGAIRLIGHNQAIRSGDLNSGFIISGSNVTPSGNASDNSNSNSAVQIGHGGNYTDLAAAGGNFSLLGGGNVTAQPDNSATGDIFVSAGGTYRDPEDPTSRVGIKVEAGNRGRFYAQIGHGGINQNAISAAPIAIDYAGGTNPFGAQTRAASVGYLGNIFVESKLGDIVVSGGDSFRPDRVWGYGLNFARIGHGGDTVRGTTGGKISVLAGQSAGATDGDINFRAGRMYRSHAQLGHGGYESAGAVVGYDSNTKTAIEADNSAEIIVTARGGISFISPPAGEVDALNLSVDWADWWFNNNTNQQGSWQVEDRWVQLGHGGRSGVRTIASRQDITVTSGTGDLANADGNVNTGGITFVSGDSDRDFAQLGHGGWSVGANDANGFTGDIRVTANGGGIRFDASILGIQGSERRLDVTYDGVNLLPAVPRLDGSGNPVAGGNAPAADTGIGRGRAAYAQLGHGGYATRGVNVGDIIINAWGGLDFSNAAAAPTVGRTVTNANIVAAIVTGTNLWLPLADLEDSVSGFGGRYQISDMISSIVPGSINIVLYDGTVITDVVRSSSDDFATAGDAAAGLFTTIGVVTTKVADIDYDRGLVRFNSAFYGENAAALQALVPGTATATFQTAQGQKDEAYVQLGHGGFNSDGANNKANNLPSNSGLIQIGAAGDINFAGGAAYRNYAQLGHGGRDTRGINSGDIMINHVDATHFVGGLSFTAGFGGHRQRDRENYAQLGHGGADTDGNHFGNITVRGTEAANGVGLLLKAGDRQDAYAQIGHGGFNSRTGTGDGTTFFGLNGNIDIQVSGDVDVVAGTARRNERSAYDDDGRLYAMIGHGGFDADATNGDTDFFNAIGAGGPIGSQAAGDGNWGHFGDIKVISTAGSINVFAGNTTPLANRVDSYGNSLGLTDPLGLLVSNGAGAEGGRGQRHFAQIGHGGYATGGNHHGNITVVAGDGAVTVVGGAQTIDASTTTNNYAQIGHGAGDDGGNTGLATETIKVFAFGANGNVNVFGGDGARNGALIGNGGNNAPGNQLGDIKIIAERNLNMQSGVGVGFDNWAKIGHGDIFDRQSGTRNGDIEVSVGDNINLGQAIIGHFNHKRDASSAFRSTSGDTFIALGRNNPYSTGTATITTTSDTVITSALAGLAGSELRIYMPTAASDLIADGTFLNDAFYTRTPAPGSGRSDESVATEHFFIPGMVTEASASFLPEGAYLGNGFGSYNLFFGAAPIIIVPPVTPPPALGGFLFRGYYDAFGRSGYLLAYDGYDGQLYSFSWADAMENESDPSTGGWGFERALDRRAGPRREGRIGDDPSILEDEQDEELERRRAAASRGAGRGGLTYYVFDPATNLYSSYKVFGVPATSLPIAQ